MTTRRPADVYTPRHLMITGGAGFIGSNFVHRLCQTSPGVTLIVLDSLTYAGSLDNLPAGRHTFVKGDICDAALVEGLLRTHDVDGIVHFAAESHVDRSIDDPGAFIQTNIVGTFQLLRAAERYWRERHGLDPARCRFHHISTDEVFGTLGADDPAFDEDTPYAPNSPYSAAKAAADHLARAYHHTYRLPIVTTNCSNNYGPRQHVEKFIPTIVRACYVGQQIPVYGDGSNRRDWLFVDDHCAALELVLRAGHAGTTYNIGGGVELANIEIAERVCAVMDKLRPAAEPHARRIEFVADRPGHDWRYAMNSAKIDRELGWRPAHDFDAGIRRTCEWYLGNELWRRRVEDGTYGGARLGLSSAGGEKKERR